MSVKVVLTDFLNEEDAPKVLSEGGATKIVRLTKKKQFNRLAGRASITIAKEKDDPLYERYRRLREKMMQIKSKLVKKYRSKARTAARKTLARS